MSELDHSWIFKRRGMVGIILFVPIGFATAFSHPVIQDGSFLDLVMDFLAWGLFITYVGFRLWATLYIGSRKDKELQTEGPYSITRNPLYLGSFCLALSGACFLKSISLLLMVGVASIIYLLFVIKDEESYLENRFGEEFEKYCQRTPRLFPSSFRYYRATASVNVNLKGMKIEAKRLLSAGLLPISVELIMHLRSASWWPHWFSLP